MVLNKSVNAYRPKKEYFDSGGVQENQKEED